MHSVPLWVLFSPSFFPRRTKMAHVCLYTRSAEVRKNSIMQIDILITKTFFSIYLNASHWDWTSWNSSVSIYSTKSLIFFHSNVTKFTEILQIDPNNFSLCKYMTFHRFTDLSVFSIFSIFASIIKMKKKETNIIIYYIRPLRNCKLARITLLWLFVSLVATKKTVDTNANEKV